MLNLFELLQMYNEMAYEKRKVLNDIRHTTFQRLRHLIKIFLYRDVRKNDMKHWINEELYNWCSDIPLIKGNKHLSHKELYKVFWDEPKDDINERNINRIVKQFINIDFPKMPMIMVFFDLFLPSCIDASHLFLCRYEVGWAFILSVDLFPPSSKGPIFTALPAL